MEVEVEVEIRICTRSQLIDISAGAMEVVVELGRSGVWMAADTCEWALCYIPARVIWLPQFPTIKAQQRV